MRLWVLFNSEENTDFIAVVIAGGGGGVMGKHPIRFGPQIPTCLLWVLVSM